MVKKATQSSQMTDTDVIPNMDDADQDVIDDQEETPTVKKKRGKVSKKVAKKRGKAIADATKALKTDPNALTPLEERFCQLYATQEFFCNGTQSYMQAAFEFTGKRPSSNYAGFAASRLLRKDKIQKRNDELIGDIYMNDQFVDKQLGKAISQDVHWSAKVASIKEYNMLKKRTAQTIVHQFSDLQTMSDAELAKEEQKLISFFTKK